MLTITKFLPTLRCRAPVLYNQPKCSIKQSVEEKLGLPLKPKRPSSAFVKFLSGRRQDIVRNNPEASPKEIMKIGSEMWKNSSLNLKTSLKEQYAKEYAKYAVEREKYNQSLTQQQRDEIKEAVEELKEKKERREAKLAETQKVKELGKPVRPLSSFLLFAKSEQHNRGERSVSAFQSYLSEKWRSLPEDAKRKYSDDAAKAKRAYDAKLLEWEKKMLRLGHLDVVRQKTLNAGKGSKIE